MSGLDNFLQALGMITAEDPADHLRSLVSFTVPGLGDCYVAIEWTGNSGGWSSYWVFRHTGHTCVARSRFALVMAMTPTLLELDNQEACKNIKSPTEPGS